MIRPGIVLDGKYEILTRIGAGGMGEIFKARHLHLDAFRCIKVMKETLLANDVYRTRFLREARLATQIHHHLRARGHGKLPRDVSRISQSLAHRPPPPGCRGASARDVRLWGARARPFGLLDTMVFTHLASNHSPGGVREKVVRGEFRSRVRLT